LRALDRSLAFSDRTVVWIEASWTDLELLLYSKVSLAEIRRPRFVDTIQDLTTNDQGEFVEDLAARVISALDSAPAICHLDTGVSRTHALLVDSLAATDVHSIFAGPGMDVRGH